MDTAKLANAMPTNFRIEMVSTKRPDHKSVGRIFSLLTPEGDVRWIAPQIHDGQDFETDPMPEGLYGLTFRNPDGTRELFIVTIQQF